MRVSGIGELLGTMAVAALTSACGAGQPPSAVDSALRRDAAAATDAATAIDAATTSDAAGKLPADAATQASSDGAAPVATDGGVVTPETGLMSYFGGRVISNVKVYAVYWGPNVDSSVRTQIEAFYPAIVGSSYLSWLSEYATPTQTIGTGSFGGSYILTPTVTGTTLSHVDLEAALVQATQSHTLPAPDENSFYMVFLPPNLSFVFPPNPTTTSTTPRYSCTELCGYHWTVHAGTQNLRYGLLPDLSSGGCETSCRFATTAVDSATVLASGTLVDAVTDPDDGFLTPTFTSTLGWANLTVEEINNACSSKATYQRSGFTVAQLWSDKAGACIKP